MIPNRYVFVPRRLSVNDRGVMPPSPFVVADQSASPEQRWSAYTAYPRGYMSPPVIGLSGVGETPAAPTPSPVTLQQAAAGGAAVATVAGSLAAVGGATIGGAIGGGLLGGFKGAIGGALGAGLGAWFLSRWAMRGVTRLAEQMPVSAFSSTPAAEGRSLAERQAEWDRRAAALAESYRRTPGLSAQALPPRPVAGLPEDLITPAPHANDTPTQRAAFRLLQASVVLSAAALILEYMERKAKKSGAE